MMKQKSIRIEAPIEGMSGKLINVGDEVVVVTHSHSVRVNKGVYLGYIRNTGNAQVRVTESKYVQIKPDGSVFNWSKDYNQATWDDVRKTLVSKNIPVERITTLQRNRLTLV
jgi:hypothetical protein